MGIFKKSWKANQKTSMGWKLLHSILGRTNLINKTQIRHGACLQTTIITYPCLLNEAHAVNVLEIWERHRREPEVVREHVLSSFPISRYCIGPGKLAQRIKYDNSSVPQQILLGGLYIFSVLKPQQGLRIPQRGRPLSSSRWAEATYLDIYKCSEVKFSAWPLSYKELIAFPSW